jgi:copper oxidase (laccase) domain-containing protein
LLSDPFYSLEDQIAVDFPGARAVFTTRSWGDVRDTHPEIAERLGVNIARVRQVHGDTVITVARPSAQASDATEADGIATATSGVAAMVIAADCVISRAVDAVRALSGGVLTAAIGPGAGVCCYEVGDDLHRRFTVHSQHFHDRGNLDLKAIARVQLMEAGVAKVHDAGICTICGDPELTFSHRREGSGTGRHAAIAWLI